MAAERLFGRYVLLDRLAVGGMAEIHLARAQGEANFLKTCVIKRVLPHLATNERFVSMFLDEARLAARLQHPSIVQIFDLGRHESDYFIAMEYLAGEDMARVGRRAAELAQSIPLDVAVSVVQSAAAALHYAHQLQVEPGEPLGIVHRDVTPSNLMLTYQGSVKVLDFGIALAASRAEHTVTGHVKGKASYMSPEQARGERVDRRTDVWALGTCLYEFLTGVRAFESTSTPATLRDVCEKDLPPPSQLRREVPEALDRVVARAVSRDLERRYATAEEFRRALEEAFPDAASASRLEGYLRELFGKDQATRSLARGVVTSAPAGHDGEGTAELFGSGQDVTLLATAPSTPRRPVRAHRGVLVGALVALAALGGLWASGALHRARAPAPAVALGPSPVPAPPPASVAAHAAELPPHVPEPARPAAPVSRPAHARARPSSGFLIVKSDVPAVVRVDGVERGTTPLPMLSLAPGRHLLQLSNSALAISRTAHVSVVPNHAVEYRPDFGRTELHVACDPWARVFLDGVEVGETPLAGHPVWEGRHRLRLVAERGEKGLTVQAVAGRPLVVKEHIP